MGEITIEVWDATGNKRQSVEVPSDAPVNRVIAGWTEALQLMAVGSEWELYIPAELAYGPQGAGGVIGPNATLIFKVKLLDIHR